MRLSVTFLGLDLFTLDLTTGEEADEHGESTTYPVQTGFCLVERDGGSPELVQ